MRSREGLSRRHLLTGVAWSAPVIVVATAVPARAASLPGAIALTGVSANQVETVFSVTAAVAYVGDAADFPVTDLVVGVRVPTARVDATRTVELSTVFWAAAGSEPDGTDTIFWFTYVGGELTAALSPTPALTGSIPKTPAITAGSLTFTADGFSGPGAVPQVQQPVDLVVGANLRFNSPQPIGFQSNYNGTGLPAYTFDGMCSWDGPHAFPDVGAPITDLTVTVRVPTANATNQVIIQTASAEWTQSQPVELDDHWVVVFSSTQTLSQGSPVSGGLQFGVVALGGPVAGIAAVRAQGLAAGSTVFDVRTGPA